MASLNARLMAVEKALATRSNGNNRDCGRGLNLEKGTPARWCHEHGYSCWWRWDPAEVARAAQILESVQLGSPELAVGGPSIELVEEARQMLLSQGLELEKGS